MPRHRHRLIPASLSALLLLTLAACGAPSGAPSSTADTQAAASNLQLEPAESDIAVGHVRFTFGLLDNNRPITPSSTRVSFYEVHGHTGTLKETLNARFNDFSSGLPKTAANAAAEDIRGVYVAYPTFKSPGIWLAQARFAYKGHPQMAQQGFRVQARSSSPAVGSPAPRTHNPTVYQMPATKLDSGRPPDDMHRLSIAAAIAQHKPLVVLFATPAFCTSRMCGPETEIVEGVENRFRGRVNFIHIEVYKNANPQYGYAPAMLQWHLLTEPWVFVIDRRGIISAKFEGPTSASEIIPAIQKTLS